MLRGLRVNSFPAYAALVVSGASLYGAAVVIVVSSARWIYSVPLVLATVFPLVLYCTRNPRLFFLFGLAFTAPLQLSINLRPHPHMGGAFALSINLVDFFLVPLIVFLARDFYLGHRRRLRLSWISAWWLSLAVLGVYAVIVGPYREMSALEVIQMLKLWVLFLVIVNECVREKHFQIVLAGLSANIALNIVIALMQYGLGRTLGLGPLGEIPEDAARGANFSVYGEVSDVFRVSGIAGHANLFGPYLAMYMSVAIALLFTSLRLPVKLLLVALSSGSLACLVLTLSRSAWATFVVAAGTLMLALFFLPELRRRFMALKVLMLGSGLVALIGASGPILQRILQSDPGAFNFRGELVKVAWKMVKDNPILGVGLNTFDFHIVKYGPLSFIRLYESFGDMFPVVHNVYMIIWSEQGTIGLLLFLGMHVNIFLIAFRNLRYRDLNDKLYMVSLGAACAILGIMVDGFASFFIKVSQFGRIFWILVGLIVATYYWQTENAPLRRKVAVTQP